MVGLVRAGIAGPLGPAGKDRCMRSGMVKRRKPGQGAAAVKVTTRTLTLQNLLQALKTLDLTRVRYTETG